MSFWHDLEKAAKDVAKTVEKVDKDVIGPGAAGIVGDILHSLNRLLIELHDRK